MNEQIVISSKQNKIKIINEFDITDKTYYFIFITVNELLYNDGNTYYEINYKYEFNSNEFILDDDLIEDVIIFKNKMTEIMVEYLLMDPEELSKISGASTAQYYRMTIMANLNKLWD